MSQSVGAISSDIVSSGELTLSIDKFFLERMRSISDRRRQREPETIVCSDLRVSMAPSMVPPVVITANRFDIVPSAQNSKNYTGSSAALRPPQPGSRYQVWS